MVYDTTKHQQEAFERVNPYAKWAMEAIDRADRSLGEGWDALGAKSLDYAQVYATLAVAFDAWSRR